MSFRTLENDRGTWNAPIRLAEDAPHARISVGGGRSALSFTARDGNETVAAASTAPLAALMAPPGASRAVTAGQAAPGFPAK